MSSVTTPRRTTQQQQQQQRPVVQVPLIAVEWTLLYSTAASDVEVARISNVCRTWRNVAKSILLQQGAGTMDPCTQQALSQRLVQRQEQQESKGDRRSDDEADNLLPVLLPQVLPPPPPPLRLLASMIQHIFLSHEQHQQQQQQQQLLSMQASSSLSSSLHHLQLLQPPPMKGRNNPQHSSANNMGGRRETFCVAWFASEGIQTRSLSLQHEYGHCQDHHQSLLCVLNNNNPSAAAAPSSATSYYNNDFDQQHQQQQHHKSPEFSTRNNSNNNRQQQQQTTSSPSTCPPTDSKAPPPASSCTGTANPSVTPPPPSTNTFKPAGAATEVVNAPVADASDSTTLVMLKKKNPSNKSKQQQQPGIAALENHDDGTANRPDDGESRKRLQADNDAMDVPVQQVAGGVQPVVLLQDQQASQSLAAAGSFGAIHVAAKTTTTTSDKSCSCSSSNQQQQQPSHHHGGGEPKTPSPSPPPTSLSLSPLTAAAQTAAAAAACSSPSIRDATATTSRNHQQQSPPQLPNVSRRNNSNKSKQKEENDEKAPPGAVLVTDEWRGYRTPIQVLQHFGYTKAFVEDVLKTAETMASRSRSRSSTRSSKEQHAPAAAPRLSEPAQQSQMDEEEEEEVEEEFKEEEQAVEYDPFAPPTVASIHHESNDDTAVPQPSLSPYATTYAVRGAVLARPESYCLCLQHEEEKENWHDELAAALDKVTGADGGCGGRCVAGASAIRSVSSREWADIRLQERQQAVLRQQGRRHRLKLDVLPRVVMSSPCKDMLNPFCANSRQQPCVQFLNAPGSSAVCMMTPPFACGPIPEPVTIFCVAIATEDGCFMSGLHHRFELGHTYPDSVLSEITERSPVCVATEGWNVYTPIQQEYVPLKTTATMSKSNTNKLSSFNNTTTSVDRSLAFASHNSNITTRSSFGSNGDSSSMDNSDDDSAASSQRKCECIFQGVSEKTVVMDADEAMIRRGTLGPGSWHCYVAVFDGDDTRIRIDGVEEENVEKDDSCVPACIRGTPLGSMRHAMLDGLTIGSDHCFGMSLCCGQSGNRGEGEGAIAELAVFYGRFDQLDINVLEQTLMDKHGIVSRGSMSNGREGGSATISNRQDAAFYWRENEFHRRAHCLLTSGLQPYQMKQEQQLRQQHQPGHAASASTSGADDYARPTTGPDPSIPLRCLARHDAVAWKQCDPVTGESRQVSKIGSRLGGSSSGDW